ncbi:MAG: hypothetical protein UY92_C0006G0128 [Candidatus Magasanikbacteria bacterium GW2011_GWA2_56_11]|uniref:Uncharacterized protein n=1 Tax=Candidatus Magasanikbacteria bacterium GW2011_GWA2_56_11 TaxID=1619044 RepID=A0A0G2AMM4_9BACT|nr:MAG: hypothetical protein UY92_C0006G0128 [Candidatus Magasanikbacteria bacterium GW2011_GWA2_56_11]
MKLPIELFNKTPRTEVVRGASRSRLLGQDDVDRARSFFGLLNVKAYHVADLQIAELDSDESAFVEENVFRSVFGGDKAKVLINHQGFDCTFHMELYLMDKRQKISLKKAD